MILEAEHAALPDGRGGLEVVPARVTVEGARVVAVERHPQGPPPPGADRLGRRLLTPAFVNAHTHLALVALRGASAAATAGNVVEDLFFRVERRLTADDVADLTTVGAYECLLSGTACAWDHYWHAEGVLDGLRRAGMAGVIAPPLQDVIGPGTAVWEAALALTERLAGDPRLADEGIGVAVGPHAPDTVSDRLWREAVDLAARHDLPLHTHLAQSVDEVRRVRARAGATPLGLLRRLGVLDAGPSWVLVHGLFLTDEDLGSLSPERHTLVACPAAQALFAFPAPVHAWEARGLRWVVASDAPATNDALDVRGELRALAALATGHVPWGAALDRFRVTGHPADAAAAWADRQRGRAARGGLLDPSRLLARVWALPGALHPAVPCGELRPGALAHLALWDLDHPAFWPGHDPLGTLALGSCTGALDQVMVAGRWRGERGHLRASLLAEDAWRAASERARARRAELIG